MPLPLIGAAVLRIGARLVGKAIAKVTKGRLIGAGGGREILRTAGRAVGTAATVGTAIQIARGGRAVADPFGSASPGGMPGGMEGGPSTTIVEISPTGKRIKKRWKASEQRYVAVRHLNVLNPRALRRSLARAEGFERFAKRTVNALHTGPKKFKSTKKRSAR